MSLVTTLRILGYEWEDVPHESPHHPILNAVRDGRKVKTSGQIPFRNGEVIAGKVGIGSDVSPEDAAIAAELCAVSCLFAAGSVVDPEEIVGIEELTVYVNCASGFTDTSSVADGASNFLIGIFGEEGRHVRAAIGVAELPLNAAVEITMVLVVL